MPRRCDLPSELAEFNSRVDYVQQHGRSKFTSSCPECGTSGHSGRSWSDRCLWYTDEGRPRGFCMKCRRTFWPGNHDKTFLSPERAAYFERMRREEYERQQAEERKIAEKLQEFSSSQLWQELHRRMSAENVSWWEKAGVSKEYQDFWKFGWTPDRIFSVGDKQLHSPAATMPIFEIGWKPVNMQYRIMLDDVPGGGRYRFEIPRRWSAFLARPDLDWSKIEEVWIVEGSKKGAVAYQHVPEPRPDTMQVMAIPSCSWWDPILDVVPSHVRKIIVPDPDAMVRPENAKVDWEPQPVQMGRAMGNAFLLTLPNKIDDMIVKSGIEGASIRRAARFAKLIV